MDAQVMAAAKAEKQQNSISYTEFVQFKQAFCLHRYQIT
jgi:hypothetical protein